VRASGEDVADGVKLVSAKAMAAEKVIAKGAAQSGKEGVGDGDGGDAENHQYIKTAIKWQRHRRNGWRMAKSI